MTLLKGHLIFFQTEINDVNKNLINIIYTEKTMIKIN